MAISQEYPVRRSSHAPMAPSLEERFEVLKEVGDGSFGNVVMARVRTAGANVARRGTLVCLVFSRLVVYISYICICMDTGCTTTNLKQVAIKTMKKTFDSFAPCLELREVIFLRTLPSHPHLVPALDIFLDPLTKMLHICMEYMDGNLYQLMKARDQKPMDPKHVKSILFQILSGLDHIHTHHFFHRDIKPENILVSTATPPSDSAFSRYSSLVTPPQTPPTYAVKIADFGLARETHSKSPYTTYVSTRWYRAPEVLLRAGEYSAPVDIWAVGAMAVEIATLKPLFPGANEVDQVWRICAIMGSPENWCNKHGVKVGGGEWRDGNRLAQKLGFPFPKVCSAHWHFFIATFSFGIPVNLRLSPDGSSSHGEYTAAAAMASFSQQLGHLVLDVGSQEPPHVRPSPPSRVFRRRHRPLASTVVDLPSVGSQAVRQELPYHYNHHHHHPRSRRVRVAYRLQPIVVVPPLVDHALREPRATGRGECCCRRHCRDRGRVGVSLFSTHPGLLPESSCP
jgi:serine/threonine protein kinase